MSDEHPESLHLAVLRIQLIYRRNAGMPADLDEASDSERSEYAELIRAAARGDAEAGALLDRRRPRRREAALR